MTDLARYLVAQGWTDALREMGTDFTAHDWADKVGCDPHDLSDYCRAEGIVVRAPLTPAALVALVALRGTLISIEGPKGAGKTTLARTLAKHRRRARFRTGPRPRGDTFEAGCKAQVASEQWLISLNEHDPGTVILDRGWVTCHVFGDLRRRPDSLPLFRQLYPADLGPRRGFVVFLDAPNDLLDPHEPPKDRDAMREAAEDYIGPCCFMMRTRSGYFLRPGE